MSLVGSIPEISNRRLEKLVRVVRPVISLVTLPQGRWPQDEVRTFFLKLPKDLRLGNLLDQPRLGQVLLVKERVVTTFHVPGSAGRVFSPTAAEVFAQIQQYCGEGGLDPVIAFETFLPEHQVRFDESGRLHVATTVLLCRASRNTGELMRYHYS